MGYLFLLLIGFGAGSIGVWMLVMHPFEDAKRKVLEAESLAQRLKEEREATYVKARELATLEAAVTRLEADFKSRIISYDELQQENSVLKRDLQNVDMMANKFEMDGQLRDQRTAEVKDRCEALGKRYLTETVKSVVDSLGSNNFTACKQRMLDAIKRCRDIELTVSASEEAKLLADLRLEFEAAVRAALEREEQARIKAQIREEEKLRREIDRELRQLERERAAVQAALDQALAEAKGQHSAEVERLQSRLQDAEDKLKRTVSMAQLTKAGHVYIISNIGSMGPGIFKVGMTRRLAPHERVDELSSASVPFPFDVHMMISTNDAPALENALHRALHKRRVNRANPRKEFFRASVEEIRDIVKEHHGEVAYEADAKALEYRQTLTMSEEDAALIETVYKSAELALGISETDNVD